MITVSALRKIYRVHKREPGLKAALRSLLTRPTEEVRAVDGISFHIGGGERVGFLGPNGAGKTTTLKMLAGLLHPSSGTLEVDGFVPKSRERAFLERITLVMGQKQQLLWDLPPSETFLLNRALYDVPEAQFKETLAELTRLLELQGLVGKPTRQLSLGERMKCELAAALLHRPKVLFLDEPTIGLDVAMQAVVRDFIRAYNQRFEATVLLTSHDMDDVAALCPRVIVIDHGKLIWDGALEDLVKRMRPHKRLRLRLARPVELADLSALGMVVEHDATSATLQVSQADMQGAVARVLGQMPLVDLSVEDPPLEEVMRDLFASGAADAKSDAGDAAKGAGPDGAKSGPSGARSGDPDPAASTATPPSAAGAA